MTSAQFDIETAERLGRIRSNPNPRAEGWLRRIAAGFKASMSWGRNLDRAAAIDSFKNVCAVIGVGTILADFGTMRVWMAAPCVLVAGLAWYADYMRHF